MFNISMATMLLLLPGPGRILCSSSRKEALSLCLLLQTLLLVVSVLAVAAAVIPWILIPLVPLAILFLFLRRYFLQTSRDVKRLESTSEWVAGGHGQRIRLSWLRRTVVKKIREILQTDSASRSPLQG